MTNLRSLLRDNAHAELLTFQASYPDLRSVHRVRPENVHTWPLAYVDAVRVSMVHDWQTRRSTGEVDIVIVGAPVVNAETVDALDTLADALVEWMTDRPHLFGSNTTQEPIRTAGGAIEVGDVGYDAVTVTLGRATFLEGLDS